jgi:hypothetical protein
MSRKQLPKPHRPHHNLPEEREPPDLPVEPDEGLVPPLIPDDPEHDRLIDPSAMRPPEGRRRAMAPRSAPGLPLPEEREESPEPAALEPDPAVAQAKRDIDADMVDTDMCATPGR